jgi:hypothetical protein
MKNEGGRSSNQMGVGVGGMGVGDDVAVGAAGVNVGANTEITPPQAVIMYPNRIIDMDVSTRRFMMFSPLTRRSQEAYPTPAYLFKTSKLHLRVESTLFVNWIVNYYFSIIDNFILTGICLVVKYSSVVILTFFS